MKKVLFGLTMLSSLSAFAGASECSNLLGNFTGSYEGSSVDMELKQVSANAISIKLNGEGGVFEVSGKHEQSDVDDTIYVAVCSAANGLEIQSTFRERVVGIIKVQAITNGIQYILNDGSQTLVINGARN